MSLLDKIKEKKMNLTSTETRVTLPSGDVLLENKTNSILLPVRNPGFVVDPNPDLKIAHILPFLLMGSQDVVLDYEILKNNHVKHVLSLGITVPHFENVSYNYLPLLDLPEFDILPYLKTAFCIIDTAKNSGEKIYVHCNAGVSRSSTIIIAYLMREKLWPYSQAYDHLKNIRPCIKPNEGFVKQLLVFEKNELCL